MLKILVSRCLLGHRVRYDGGAHGPFDWLERWQAQGRLVPICPEVAGGLPTPRPPAEIIGGQGEAVLDGRVRVLSIEGADVTQAFVRGAEQALALVGTHRIGMAILKARSPSCGNEQTYDGSFTGTRVDGEGVTAALLRHHGVTVFHEGQLEQAAAWLAAHESQAGTTAGD